MGESKEEELNGLLNLIQKMEEQNKKGNPFGTVNMTGKEKCELEKYRNKGGRGLTKYEIDKIISCK